MMEKFGDWEMCAKSGAGKGTVDRRTINEDRGCFMTGLARRSNNGDVRRMSITVVDGLKTSRDMARLPTDGEKALQGH